MASSPFASYAQNGEDVVIWRALRDVAPADGRYVEVGANDPVVDSLTWALYLSGWRGVTVEPVHAYAEAHRARRPGDRQVEAVVGALDEDSVVFHEIAGTGLSTIDGDIAARHAADGYPVEERRVPVRRLDDVLVEAGYDDGRPLHLLTVDTEGAEPAVLRSLDLRRFRPWVLVVEATAPRSDRPTHEAWEPGVLEAGYELCLFDGLSRFYCASEHAELLRPRLSTPASVLDDYTTPRERALADDLEAARGETAAARGEVAAAQGRLDTVAREAVRWRTAALTRWGDVVAGPAATPAGGEVVHLRSELEAMRRTVSWRVTRPLRAVRSQPTVVRAARALRARAGTVRRALP